MEVRDRGLTQLETKSVLGAISVVWSYAIQLTQTLLAVLKINCPFSIENTPVGELTPAEISKQFGGRFFLIPDENYGGLHLNPKQTYCAQVRGEMNIISTDWCDFVVYSGGTVFVDRNLNDFCYWEDEPLPASDSFF